MDSETLSELRNDTSEWLSLSCLVTDKVVQHTGGSATPTSVSNGMGGVIVVTPVATGMDADTVNARSYLCRATIPVRDSAANEFQSNERSAELVRVELILPYDAEIYLTSQVAITYEDDSVILYEVERLQPYTDVIARHVTVVQTGDNP